MAAARQGPRKRQWLDREENDIFSTQLGREFEAVRGAGRADVRDTCASSRHFSSSKKSAKNLGVS